ncbi:MAG TPA: hypothetical protein VJ843_06115 [Candidatus Saccharimonadales bacterium]|nr:hypothetical protein [Candidatus Saccharimonadales bacterium]
MDDQLDNTRDRYNFYSPKVLMGTVGIFNSVLDPYSVLIGDKIKLGRNNVFYPNVIIECTDFGEISIGNDNTFYPGTYVFSSEGSIVIGDSNEFGVGGCTIRANMPEADIRIGNNGRYCGGADIMGQTTLGNGSQILGNITVQSCALAAGGTFKDPDPDKRASVLKGYGLARGIALSVGEVLNGMGNFAEGKVEQQSAYHPKKS